MKALGAATGMSFGPAAMPDAAAQAGSQTATMGPSSVLLYGQGFGAIALAQAKTTPDLAKQLQTLQKTSQILGTTTIGNVKAQSSARRSAASSCGSRAAPRWSPAAWCP